MKGPGITKKAAGASCSACSAAALEALIGLITTALKKGLNVVLTGLGAFRVSERAARTGVNPR